MQGSKRKLKNNKKEEWYWDYCRRSLIQRYRSIWKCNYFLNLSTGLLSKQCFWKQTIWATLFRYRWWL